MTQDELRASLHRENSTGFVLNRAWNGHTILLSGAQNEVVSFNLVLEAATQKATHVSVSFDTLTGPSGAQIHSVPATANGVVNWVNRPIELFYVRYLPIHGLSYFGYGKWDERQVPLRFQRPWSGPLGTGSGGWLDRPDHDKNYPDICVPLELASPFDIAAGQNQSIWSDIYVPKTAPSGTYTGTVTISENGTATYTVPVQLSVQGFALPDEPTSKTMLYVDGTEIMMRYVAGAGGYANWSTNAGHRIARITDKYYELLHRHKIAAVGENECPIQDHPCDSSVPRLDGSLYTAANGYDGPGVQTPNGIFSIGTYGTWGWGSYGVPAWRSNESLFWQHANNFVSWFEQNLPTTEYVLYLQDEPQPSDYSQVDTWARWIHENPGPGQRLKSFTTHTWFDAQTTMPHVDIPASGSTLGGCPNGAYQCDAPTVTQAAANSYLTAPGKELWMYNDCRVCAGSADTEDDGVSMRVMPWAQYKKQVHRWFYWFANLNGSVDPFTNTVTWGHVDHFDASIGWTGNDGVSNGDGLLLYPGHTVYPGQTDYGIDGPIASVRLKEWRRGIQDTDYLALAARYEPDHAKAILQRVVPYVLWEYPDDTPTFYQGGGPSWSTDPDVWETARAELAQIITNHCATGNAALEANSPCTAPAATGSDAGGSDPTSVSTPSPRASSAPVALQFVPMVPCRLVDTRSAPGDWGGPFLAAGTIRTFSLRNSPCSLPATAQAVAVNATVVPHARLRWLSLWPSKQAQPSTSILNSLDGRIKANAAILPLGTDGGLSVYATDDTDFVLDISGYFVSGASSNSLVFYPVAPCRLVDTRENWGALGGSPVAAGQERRFPVLTSSCAIPSTVQAYSLNYTAIPKKQLTWLAAWPSGQATPAVSTLNATTGAVTANAAITVAGENGDISVYASDDTDLVIDINGYFAPPSTGGLSFYALPPCRSYDTRSQADHNALEGLQTFPLSQSDCGLPASASVVLLNLTAVPSGPLKYVTLWAAGASQPFVSTLNAYDGQITSNFALVPASQGSINAFTTEKAHLIFDTLGYFAP